MPTFTMTKTYSDSSILHESDLDGMKTSTETFLNTTKLDSTNIQTGGIATSNIADSAITEAKIATSVAGSGLTGGGGSALAVNVDNSTLQIATNTVLVKDGGITGAKVAANTITSSQIAAGTITNAKLAATNTSSTSLQSGGFTNTSPFQVASISSFTVSGTRSVQLRLEGAGGTLGLIEIFNTGGAPFQAEGRIQFLRDGAVLGEYPVEFPTLAASPSASDLGSVASSGFSHWDISPTAGTHTYSVNAYLVNNQSGSLHMALSGNFRAIEV